jgi:hypothetical protein
VVWFPETRVPQYSIVPAYVPGSATGRVFPKAVAAIIMKV